jgi:tripartite-type tricarboxylate transporter receptor subunit TctC
VRPIFTGTAERLAVLPDLPSAKEVGLADFNAASWLGLAVATATPQPVKAKLHAELVAAVQAPAFKTMIDRLGMTVLKNGSLDELNDFMQREIERWGAVVRASGAKTD